MSFWSFAMIFILDLVASYAWAKSISKIEKKKPHPAALWGTGLYIAGAVTIIFYNKDNWYLIPAILGSYVGIYLGVKYEKDDNKN